MCFFNPFNLQKRSCVPPRGVGSAVPAAAARDAFVQLFPVPVAAASVRLVEAALLARRPHPPVRGEELGPPHVQTLPTSLTSRPSVPTNGDLSYLQRTPSLPFLRLRLPPPGEMQCIGEKASTFCKPHFTTRFRGLDAEGGGQRGEPAQQR